MTEDEAMAIIRREIRIAVDRMIAETIADFERKITPVEDELRGLNATLDSRRHSGSNGGVGPGRPGERRRRR